MREEPPRTEHQQKETSNRRRCFFFKSSPPSVQRNDIGSDLASVMASSNVLHNCVAFLWGRRQENALWQALLKYAIAIAIAIALAFLPAFRIASTFLIPMIVAFAHPGQRMGLMIQSLLMVLFGAGLGLSWSLLGLRLALLVGNNTAAASTIRALFLLVLILVHGYLRSSNPRLMLFVIFLLITAVLTVQLPVTVTGIIFSTAYIPLLVGAGVLLIVNLAIFPELSSSYLGSTTIDTLSETVDTLTRATNWFVTPGGDPDTVPAEMVHSKTESAKSVKSGAVAKFLSQFPNPFRSAKRGPALFSTPHHSTSLSALTEQKPKLRACLAHCKAVQDEVNFEISFSPLPPTALKPISIQYMTGLVRNVTTLIGACENKFVVVGKNEHSDEKNGAKGKRDKTAGKKSGRRASRRVSRAKHFPSVKPIKEIETSSAELLEAILTRIRGPAQVFQVSVAESANLVILCLAYCFDVPKLPSGAAAPRTVSLQELDVRIDKFARSLTLFDTEAANQLRENMMDKSYEPVDFMPGMETFMASSFILSLRDSAAQLLEMLRHLRLLVESRQRHHDHSRLWVPQLTIFRQWLAKRRPVKAAEPIELPNITQTPVEGRVSGPIPAIDHPDARQTPDDEGRIGQTVQWAELKSPKKLKSSKKRARRKSELQNLDWMAKTREKAADALEWAQKSNDLDYALKLAVAMFLLLWPAFFASWRPWYTQVRGIWAPMQLMLVFEVCIGSSAFGFFLRLIGVVYGCVAGFAAYEVGRGNRVGVAVVLFVVMMPSIYLHLVAPQYAKVAIVSIVSMSVVALASINGTVPAYEIFYKRLVAFLVGGIVAMLVEVVIAPVRARDRLVECLSYSVRQIQKMEMTLAVGIEGPWSPNIRSQALLARFNRARDKAHGALADAESALPFCLREPRLKGSFKPLAPIYTEITYVLHQIIDRMDNLVQLRRTYGSSILEDLNSKVYAYRRNVAASTTLMLFSINEALTTWLPLPQFLPSARLALIRLISRVREIVASDNTSSSPRTELDEETATLITKRKFLSWNAGAVGQIEIVEYLEELIELVKLLVGVNGFRSGMLEQSSFGAEVLVQTAREPEPEPSESGGWSPVRWTATTVEAIEECETSSESGSWDEGIPLSLQRVGTRLRRGSSVVRRRAASTAGIGI
ncbi:hypothetical protein CDD80_1430 [Ophiocordyceps camponoti-rufipedis]|uniref:Uncharacterized protein n=1 Tax=Ophiocordyceps camponoti-rufipedis TaxID=2004952 RepID=A0A2C5XM34_9HYPO|nr:hypothetical protein CDD80_1430 [Ophiocordyceps camponoti-rufipedis]